MLTKSDIRSALRGFMAVMVGVGISGLGLSPASAQDEEESETIELSAEDQAQLEELSALMAQQNDEVEAFGWEREGSGKLGNEAEILIPEGYRFTGRRGTEKLMDYYGNMLTGQELGTLAVEDMSWCVVFEFDKVGYVKDDEKDEIEAGELMASFKENEKQANKQRRKMGLETMDITGWAKEPFYNEGTNRLEWAIRLRTQSGGEVVNYQSRLLGRRGVMSSTLICDPQDMESILPVYQGLLVDFSYAQGSSYAEYKKGDKIAEYGLKGLIVGGGVFAAAKLGLLGVIGKYIGKLWILIVAAVIGLKGFIVRLFTGKKNEYTTDG